MEKLKKFTLIEKVEWTSGIDLWHAFGHEKLGLKPLLLADGPHGVRIYSDIVKEVGEHINRKRLLPSTMFPSAVAMASTFNDELIYQVGETIAKECNMFGVDILLAPGLNLKRSPLGGRNFEYYSEDVVLTTNMGIAFVNGVQSQGIGATVKHFAFNEQETNRRFVNTIIDERTMHELYLKPFEEVIKKANPYAVMTAYNKVNGDYATESKDLINILRSKWNYDGVIMSDWGGVQNKVKSIKAGTNLEMPGPSEFSEEVYQALKDGTLKEQELDEVIKPSLALYDKLKNNQNKFKETSLEENHNIARKVAEEAIVLLKNNCLPLNLEQIGIIGEFAEKPRANGGGSVTLKPYKLEIPLEYFKEEFKVEYAQGYDEDTTNETLLKEVTTVAKNNDTVIYFTGTTSSMDNEGHDRTDMSLPFAHIKIYKEIRKHAKNVIVILNNGSQLDLRVIDDCDALIEAWFLGSANSKALVDVITGKLNPSGRLSETIPLCMEHTPLYKSYPSFTNDVNYNNDIINLGYRYYDTHNYEVKYPFGYGLSYSEFRYDSISVSSKELTNNKELTVTVTVTNVSENDGYEVVQLYINDEESYYPRPNKELKRYKKIFVEAGNTETITFTLSEKDFSIYAVDYKEFRVEEGYFNILVGKNVNDMLLSERIFYKTDNLVHKNITLKHPLNIFKKYKQKEMKNIISKYRDFPWYEAEEPMLRVMKRLRKEFEINESEFERLLKALTE